MGEERQFTKQFVTLREENLKLRFSLERLQVYHVNRLKAAGLPVIPEDVASPPDTMTTEGSNLTEPPPPPPPAPAPAPAKSSRGPLYEPTLNRDNESPTSRNKPQYLYTNPIDKLRQTLLNTILTRCLVAKILHDWTRMELHATEAENVSRKLDYPPLEAYCQYYRGISLYHQHKWYEALEAFEASALAKGKYVQADIVEAWIEKIEEAIGALTPLTPPEENEKELGALPTIISPTSHLPNISFANYPLNEGWNVSSETLIGSLVGAEGEYTGRHHRRISSSNLSTISYRSAVSDTLRTPQPGATFKHEPSSSLDVRSRSLGGRSSSSAGSPPPPPPPSVSLKQRGVPLSRLRTPRGVGAEFLPIGRVMGLEPLRSGVRDSPSPPIDTRALGDLLEGRGDTETEGEESQDDGKT